LVTQKKRGKKKHCIIEYIFFPFSYVDYLFETESLQRQSIVHHLTADSEAYGTSLRTAIAAAKSVAKRNALIEIATMPYPQSTLAEYILLLVRQSIVRGVIRVSPPTRGRC